MKGRLAAALGVVALLSVPSTALAQTEAVTTPAPPGSAEAVAAELEGVVAIAHTKADANQSSGSATANALEVLGAPPVAQVGGTQEGFGSTQGALLDTGENPDFRVAVLPWQASVTQGSTHSLARAALARVVLGDLVTLNVLQSESRASHLGLTSTGDASSDGVTLDVLDGALDIVLLHSEAHSTGEGETFLISINDTKLLTEDEVGDVCNIDIPSLLKVVCLSVSGGVGSVAASAAGVNAVQDAIRSNVVASVGSGQPTAVQSGQVGAGDAGGGVGQLPKTGADVMNGVLYGIALLALGSLVLAVQKTRERMALRAI